jgi:hypothetical protein
MLNGLKASLRPEDLAICQHVFDQICADGSRDAASLDAEFIASTVLTMFRSGMREEAELLAKVRSLQDQFIKPNG